VSDTLAKAVLAVLLAASVAVVAQLADLLIVDADPSVDIRNTRRIRYVIKDGRLVSMRAARR